MKSNDLNQTYVIVISNSYSDKNNLYADEFFSLVWAAGYKITTAASQSVKTPNIATYVGSGFLHKVKDLIEFSWENHPETIDNLIVATSFDLSGTQRANLEKILGVEVVDRTFIILKIFENNARTKEAKLQVEIASLQWEKNHLRDSTSSLSQVTSGGGLHNKGSGEKQITLDRRHIAALIDNKKRELEHIKLARKNSRTKRNNSGKYKIAIVGYTNAGKSTLINGLIAFANGEKFVAAKDDLFVTLETSTREINKYGYMSLILTDTVGFVRDLPTTLVEAFKSTLEEITEADLLVHVVDISSSEYKEKIETTNSILKEIGVESIPSIYLLNKYDLLTRPFNKLLDEDSMFCSLINEEDIPEVYKFICSALSESWNEVEVEFPYEKDYASFSADNYVISSMKNKNGYQCTVRINPRTAYKYSYLLDKNS